MKRTETPFEVLVRQRITRIRRARRIVRTLKRG